MQKFSVKKHFETDIVVIGGGTAGVFAAISAARSGADTVLLEKNSILGGTVTAANVNFPGLFFAWGEQIIAGPCFEAIEKTIALGGSKMPKIQFRPEKHWHEQFVLNRFVYTSVITEMCLQAGVKLVLNSMVSDITETENGVTVLSTDKDGLCEIKCKNLIDCSGDATAVALAGYPTVKSEIQQPATLQNSITGYDKSPDYTEKIAEKISEFDIPDYITAEKLNAYLKNGKIDYHILSVDAHTAAGKTKLETDALKLLTEIYRLYRAIPELENLTVDFIAEETGVRETVRITGETEITKEDYLKGRFYDDSVCYSFYPVDLHIKTGVSKEYLADNIIPKIPYSALIPKGSKHIITAGRCISSDTLANSAVRVQATCMATGQAAGCAAALACKTGSTLKEVNYKALCESLVKLGAIVPER